MISFVDRVEERPVHFVAVDCNSMLASNADDTLQQLPRQNGAGWVLRIADISLIPLPCQTNSRESVDLDSLDNDKFGTGLNQGLQVIQVEKPAIIWPRFP